MFRCLTCGERIPVDEEQAGSRCPRCREPIYENPRESRSLPATLGASRCTSHEQNAAIGTCQRCGNFICAVCQTRWRDQVLCLGCVTRGLESKEAIPAEARAHFRQAVLSVLLGGLVWLIGLLSVVMLVAGVAEGPNLVLAGSGLSRAADDAATGAAGNRSGRGRHSARGDHMILATLGLFLSGLHTGALLGLLTFALWQNQ